MRAEWAAIPHLYATFGRGLMAMRCRPAVKRACRERDTEAMLAQEFADLAGTHAAPVHERRGPSILSPRRPDPRTGLCRHPGADRCHHGVAWPVEHTGPHGESYGRFGRHPTERLMTRQGAPSVRRRNIDQNWSDLLASPDHQFVFLIVLIALLITACLASAFPPDNDAISAIGLLS